MSATASPKTSVAPAATLGGPNAHLSDDAVRGFVHAQLDALPLDGRSVCVLVPDATRSCPLPLLTGAVHDALATRASRVTFLVALGTHAPMTDDALARHLGPLPEGGSPGRAVTEVRNHAWWDPTELVHLGEVPAARMAELSDGRLHTAVDVVLNRHVVDCDVALLVGPVFPTEVVGFSGGNKYVVPGVAGQEIIDFSHWLVAPLTSADIIGTRGTTRSAPSSTLPSRCCRAVGSPCRSSSRQGPPPSTPPPSARPRRPGPQRRTCPPGPTSATSTPRSAASCR